MRHAVLLSGLIACVATPEVQTLSPYPNPVGPGHPHHAPQPHRDNPLEVVARAAGDTVWVSLQGSVDEPGDAVAWLEVATGATGRLVTGGSSPTGLALHPNDRWLIVFQRFSDHAALVDVTSRRVVTQLPVDFYAIEGVFETSGEALWVTSRWSDEVVRYRVAESRTGLALTEQSRTSVGTNPRDLAITPDGDLVAVASITAGTVSLIDTATAEERHRIDLGAPASGLAFAGRWLVVGTLSASTHHLPFAGPDTNGDGLPGDGTPNVNFQDLQSEIAVIDPFEGTVVHRYTASGICCFDYRDVDPDDHARHGYLLPPASTWIVDGALPEQVAATPAGDAVWVTYSASNQIQRFAVDAETGALSPGPIAPTTGHNPHGLALDGSSLWVAHRLGETLGRYDAATGAPYATHPIGDLSGGAFPATDTEIGELFNFVTAPFTVDGGQACAMCHREGGNLDKAFSMPLTRRPGVGLRMTMAYRGAADTRPWFAEAAFDETNFKPVMNEFARIENFCCTDYTLFPSGAPADCAVNPPPACQTAPNASSTDGFAAAPRHGEPAFPHPRPTSYPTRDAFYLARALEILGRDQSFGDGAWAIDPFTGARRPIPLDFDGITRALGAFLMIEPQLLPNPNDPASDAARRGRALFHRADVGCALCHPAPTFAASTDHNPHGVRLRQGPVVSPYRDAEGINLDLYAQGFLDTFPRAEQDRCEDVCDPAACADDPDVCDELRNVYFGIPSLRGLWDRAPGMLHHGLATGVREVLATPGHPVLREGERGFNESDGIPDTHGSTSHLSARDLEDIAAYLETL